MSAAPQTGSRVFTLRTFFGIIDRHTITVMVLALISTHVALRFDLSADMPADIISIAVIFPIVFSINAAYMRREEALRYLASMRSHLVGIFYAHRDWARIEGDTVHTERARAEAIATGDAIRGFLQTEPDGARSDIRAVYQRFSDLSKSLEGLRDSGLSSSDVSRANQYLRALMMDFELLRNIVNYRTPVPLRAYSHVFLNSFPIVFGPYFASLSNTFYPTMGYAVAALYALVLVSLDNIQEELEDPFDAFGIDDIRLDDSEFFAATLR